MSIDAPRAKGICISRINAKSDANARSEESNSRSACSRFDSVGPDGAGSLMDIDEGRGKDEVEDVSLSGSGRSTGDRGNVNESSSGCGCGGRGSVFSDLSLSLMEDCRWVNESRRSENEREGRRGISWTAGEGDLGDSGGGGVSSELEEGVVVNGTGGRGVGSDCAGASMTDLKDGRLRLGEGRSGERGGRGGSGGRGGRGVDLVVGEGVNRGGAVEVEVELSPCSEEEDIGVGVGASSTRRE